jgi:hypothetical protein
MPRIPLRILQPTRGNGGAAPSKHFTHRPGDVGAQEGLAPLAQLAKWAFVPGLISDDTLPVSPPPSRYEAGETCPSRRAPLRAVPDRAAARKYQAAAISATPVSLTPVSLRSAELFYEPSGASPLGQTRVAVSSIRIASAGRALRYAGGFAPDRRPTHPVTSVNGRTGDIFIGWTHLTDCGEG